MFTTEHFIWIGLCASFIVIMCFVAKKYDFNLKQAGYIMCAICIISEVTKVMSGMTLTDDGGRYLEPNYLPFHLCSLMIFVIFYLTFAEENKRKQKMINFISVAGTLGSFCAIMIPTNGTDFTTSEAYQCFVYHGGLMWYSIYLIISKQADLGNIKTLRDNIITMLCLTFLTLYVNGAFSAYDTNFFFLTRPPMEGLPYLNLNMGWYVYFVRLVILGLFAISLFHLPFILKKNRK